MRRDMVLLVCLLLTSQAVFADATWAPTNRETTVQGAGDLLSAGGSALILIAEAPSAEGFAGAITSINAAVWRGQEIALSGHLNVIRGSGAAALWVRADGDSGRLAFRSSASSPVVRGDGVRERIVHLFVPHSATSIKLGGTLQGIGEVAITSLRLSGSPRQNDDVSAHVVVEAAMRAMEDDALKADRINWKEEKARLHNSELVDAPSQEAFSVIEALIRKLDDRHSALLPPRDVAKYRAQATPTHAVEVSVSNGIGYVSVPGVTGTDRQLSDALSAEMCKAIQSHAGDASKGWIVDLRDNSGGNMWPMLAGLRSLLGNGSPGAFLDRARASSPWKIRPVEGCDTDLSMMPVAVLISPTTASSGEAVAVAFKGRSKTRFFGLPTAGLATSNRSFPLPDGSMLMLTTAVFADRSGTAYPSGLIPDQQENDKHATLEAAESWLGAQD